MLKIKCNKKGAMFGLDFEPLRKQFGELFLAKRQSEAPQGANGSCRLIKHGAMFGLDFEPLRKQFGELFLAKRQSEAPQGANGSCGLIKHGAMFGLDARIALAIFGALSVISGAALYSAIQQAKAVQWQTYFSELNKASEAYYLDTGREIPITSHTLYDDERLYLSISDLVINEDDIAGWQGPYWQTTYANTGMNDNFIRDNMTSTIYKHADLSLFLRQASNWSISIDINAERGELCTENSTDCAEWFTLIGRNSVIGDKVLKVFNMLDEKLDDGDGPWYGKVRYSTQSFGYLFFKGRNRIYRGV